ncbi:MAG: hypothetical protein C0399_05085 [Syntrophus sp. (in: bacteria)]|nr:hypothetical protein [Syntrophus sp. (in: bacteria)]
MEIYCTQLGMMIEISYCLSVNEGLPCGNMMGCWQERIDVMAILKAKFNDEQLRKAFSNLPKSKLGRIMEALKSVHREE